MMNNLVIQTVIHESQLTWYKEEPEISFGFSSRAAYHMGLDKPHFPVPAIPLKVKYDCSGCVNIDDVTDLDDPVIVYMYDSWSQEEVT